jgi:hypothetical protein
MLHTNRQGLHPYHLLYRLQRNPTRLLLKLLKCLGQTLASLAFIQVSPTLRANSVLGRRRLGTQWLTSLMLQEHHQALVADGSRLSPSKELQDHDPSLIPLVRRRSHRLRGWMIERPRLK